MGLYIEKNMEIQEIFQNYATKRDHYFLFEVKMVENTRSYKYIGHQYALKA